MLGPTLTRVLLLRAVLTGAFPNDFQQDRNPLGVFANGFIVEYGESAGHNDLHSVASHVKRSTNRAVEVDPKGHLSSPIFNGASYSISRTSGLTTDAQLRAAILQHPNVIGVYPNTKRYLLSSDIHPLDGYFADADADADALDVASPGPPSARPKPAATRPNTKSKTTLPPPRIYSLNETLSSIANPHALTNVSKLHAQGITGRGIQIAILDTGIDASHPVFLPGFGPGKKITAGYDFVGEDPEPRRFTASPSPITTCNNHGTAVASLAAGQPYKFGWVGVAPGATLAMYKVFKCAGDTDTDIGVNASLSAFAAGADIISVSIGSDGGWGNDLWSIIAKRILDRGTLYIVAAGNSGQEGPFTSNGIASSFDVPTVGSVDNEYIPSLVANGSYRVDGGQEMALEYAPGFPANWTGTLEVLNIRTNGCVPYPEREGGYKSNQVVIVPRPSGGSRACNQTGRAMMAGIRNIIIHNDMDDAPLRPLPVSITEGFPFKYLDGIANVDLSTGTKLLDLLAAGHNITLSLPWKPEADDRSLRLVQNSVSAGDMSVFSTWGPTYEAKLQTSVAAPGGFLMAAGANMYGGLVVASGTSFAAPYLAGVAALVKQANPGLGPRDVMRRITATARPIHMISAQRSTQPFLAPAFQQGAGLVDAWAAVKGTTTVNVTDLAFNDTTAIRPVAFRVMNIGRTEVEYRIGHTPAVTVYTFLSGNRTISRFGTPGYTNLTSVKSSVDLTPATISFSTGSFKLTPGAGQDILVTCTPPTLEKTRLPLYSGFISINGSDGTTLSIPYGGIAGKLKDVMVLDTTEGQNRTFLIRNTIERVNATTAAGRLGHYVPPNSDSNTFIVPRTNNLAALRQVVLPGYQFHPYFGSRQANISVISNGTNLGPINFYEGEQPPEYYVRNNDYQGVWNGMLGNGSFVGNGTYRFLVRMLRVTGDAGKGEDWDGVVTGEFILGLVP